MAMSDVDRLRAENEKKREKIAQARVETRAKEAERTEDIELKKLEAESVRLDAELAQVKAKPLSEQLAEKKKAAASVEPVAASESGKKSDDKSNGGN